jgi:glycosyltransferase involved in cell wall biosynthesis
MGTLRPDTGLDLAGQAGDESALSVAMAPGLPLSVCAITLNEETNLRRCLASVADLAAEIVVLDSGSTDGTAEVARSFGAVFEHSEWPGIAAQRQKALARCRQPWVLCLDADEALTSELAEGVRQVLRGGDSIVNGFWVNRRTWYLGAWIWHAWYPEWRLRLVRRERATCRGLGPHDRLEVPEPTRRLTGDLLHYSFVDLDDHLRRTLRYARLSADAYAAAGRPFRWRQLLVSPWLAVFKHLVLKQGWRDGWRGWLISAVRGIDVFAKYAFLLERERMRQSRGSPTANERR